MMMKFLGNCFLAMLNLYAVGLLFFLLGRYFIGEIWVFIAFLNNFAHLFLLPSLILLPLSLLLRRWHLSLALLPSVLFIIWQWGALFLPASPVQAQGNERPLTILSYNIRSDGRDSATFLNVIRQADAGIVALQELGNSEAEAIQANLSSLYPYMALHPSIYPTQGQGVLSRFPLSEDTYWQYEYLPAQLGHQRIVADLGKGLSLTLYNLHPSHAGMTGEFYDPSFHKREIDDILALLALEEGKRILVGDFNMTDLSEEYGLITEEYSDAFREAGQGFGWTFTRRSPAFLRLDYLFYNEGIRAVSARVEPSTGGSDHYPLFVELLLTEP
jgi:endonuclease/exonuclease/phosphatase (EEP) superfamily protein YafD